MTYGSYRWTDFKSSGSKALFFYLNISFEDSLLYKPKASQWTFHSRVIETKKNNPKQTSRACLVQISVLPQRSFPLIIIKISVTYIWISVKLSLTVDIMLPHPMYHTPVSLLYLFPAPFPVQWHYDQPILFPVLFSVQCNGYLGE